MEARHRRLGANRFILGAPMIMFAMFAVCAAAPAGVISSIDAPRSDATVNTFMFSAEGNDDVAFSGNFLIVDLSFNSPDPITVSFSVANSPTNVGSITEYFLFFRAHLETDMDWAGLKVVLSSEMPSEQLEFDTESKGTGIGEAKFGGPVAEVWESRLLRWDSDLNLEGNPALETGLDVPNSPDGSAYDFTIRVEPIPVPEPASVVMMALAGLLLARRRPGRAAAV